MQQTQSTVPSAAIYLDYQASTPIDLAVVEAMCESLKGPCGNPHSSEHAFGWAANNAVERARTSVAAVVGVDSNDIVFTSGATEANNLALFGVAARAPRTRDTLLVSSIEHASVLAPARELAARGFRVMELPVWTDGRVDMSALDRALNDSVLLVSIGAVNNEVGTIQDLSSIGERCRAVGAMFHTDAAQAMTAGELPLGELPVDFASLSSHKSYGPSGIGALYVAPGCVNRIVPQLLGGDQQQGLRSGTLPTALCVGFGRACEILAEVGATERRRVAELRDHLWKELKALIPGLLLNGPREPTSRHPGNLNLAFQGVDARDLIQRLQPNLACSTGSACHSGNEDPSYVLSALGYDQRRAKASLRLSLGRQTTKDNVLTAAQLIATAWYAETAVRAPAGLSSKAASIT
jgi:cysteine desulfurase